MRGSSWAKWDLHVHTPSSVVQNYGGNDGWPRFINELESLHPSIKVIGISDYWFLDGYERVVNEKKSGRLKNIDLILPVIEMRLSHLAGANEKLKRVNIHVIFDELVSHDVIQAQFVSKLSGKFQLIGGDADAWDGVASRESLQSLGQSVIDSTPPEKRKELGSPMQVGFSNFVVPIEGVIDALSSHFFTGRYVMALGNTEWGSMKWEAGSAATKRTLINRCQLVFTAFRDSSDWSAKRKQLQDANVVSNLVDCSDAHNWSDSKEKDRLGNCDTWIRSTTTFRGLLHALEEFESRVYVGSRPPELTAQESRPEAIISSMTVRPRSPELKVPIKYTLDLNPGFCVVVGNKGQGKSALLDLIARGGNSSRQDDFAFLNSRRFLRPSNLVAKDIEIELTWANQIHRLTGATDSYSSNFAEEVEYLPQALIEKVCSSDPSSDISVGFEAELRRVLFSHLSIEEREQSRNFEESLEARLGVLDPVLRSTRARLRTRIDDLLVLLGDMNGTDKDALLSRLRQLEESILLAEREYSDAEAAFVDAQAADTPEVEKLRLDFGRAEAEYQSTEGDLRQQRESVASIRAMIRDLDNLFSEISTFDSLIETFNVRLIQLLTLPPDSAVVELKVRRDLIDERRNAWQHQLTNLEVLIHAQEQRLADLARQRGELSELLSVADKVREQKRLRLSTVGQRLNALRGSVDEPQTLLGIQAQLTRVEELPTLIEACKDAVLASGLEIYEILNQRLTIYSNLYEPATRFVRENPLAAEVGFEFTAKLIISSAWSALTEGLDGRKSPSLIEFLHATRAILESPTIDFVQPFINEVIARMSAEGGDLDNSERDLRSATRKTVPTAEYLYQLVSLEWLDTQISLTKDGQPLEQLSPGQRGLILLLFYLVVDNSRRPLLLDQPEENLDNEAIKTLLVPAIREASKRRQVILVTHNANLAVVGDADQIIHAKIDESGQFTVEAGALPDANVGEASINILEGARPAFLNRQKKYEKVVRP